MKWTDCFDVVGVVPGKVVWAKTNKDIDLTDESYTPEYMMKLYEDNFPYLRITEKGADYLYGSEDEVPVKNEKVDSGNLPSPRLRQAERVPTVKNLLKEMKQADTKGDAWQILQIRPDSKTLQRQYDNMWGKGD